MSVLTPSALAVIDAPLPAQLVTINRDGSPQVSLVWVGFEDGEIVTAHLGRHQKVRNVERDPRVVLSIRTGQMNPVGMEDYLVVHGRARITEGGAPELLHRLAQSYVGPGTKFPPMDDPPPGVITRITPERIGGSGPWMKGH